MPPVSDKPLAEPSSQASQGEGKVDFNIAQLPKERQRGGTWRLLIFSFMVFATLTAAYVGLHYGYERILNDQNLAEQKKIEDFGTQFSRTEQDKYLKFYFQLKNLETILGNHIIPSKVFSLLQQITHAEVILDSVSFDADGGKVTLSGSTRSYDTLIQQLDALSSYKSIQRYDLGKIGAQGPDDKIPFAVTLYITPKFFNL